MKSVRTILVTAAALAGLSAAQAADLVYTFDSDLQGWSVLDGGTPAWIATGGQAGGYLQITDVTGGDLMAVLPAAGLGNWSAYLGGSISFDARNVNGDSPDWPTFGLITMTSTAGTLSLDIAAAGQPPADGQWHHFSVPLTVAVWGANLPNVLANLNGLTIGGEFHNGISEVVGFDNIQVSAVPEPGASALWMAGLTGLALLMRRRRT